MWSALAFVLGLGAAAAQGGSTELRVQGTELQFALPNRTLRGRELLGAELELDGFGSVRIDGVHHEPKPGADGVWLYTAQLRPPGGTAFQPLCEPDPGGDTRLVFFQSELDGQQQYVDAPERFSLSCVSGVQAKCLRWGYQPWRQAPFGGMSLAPYFEACLRLARADHCGDGVTGTSEGNLIDVYDRIGVQSPEFDPGELAFEAGWNPGGAVCAHHPRIADGRSLTELAQQCPGLSDEDVGEVCDEAYAMRRGALLFNRSRIRLSR
jgi:hypothetical protein